MADLTPLAQRVLERLDGIVDGDGDVDLGGRFGYLKPENFERIVAATQSLVAAQVYADLGLNAGSSVLFDVDAELAKAHDTARLDWLEGQSWVDLSKTDESDNNGVGALNSAVTICSTNPDGEAFHAIVTGSFRAAIDSARQSQPSDTPPLTLASLSRRIDELDAEVQRLETVKLDIEPGVR